MSRIFNTDRTEQSPEYKEFGDIDIKTLVAQITGPTGTRNAQLTFAVGMAASPPKNARMQVVEVNSALYAIGGYCPKVQEELGLSDGESAMFGTDAEGNLKCATKYKKDGTVETTNDNGVYKLHENGQFHVAGAGDFVALAAKVDDFISKLDSVFRSWAAPPAPDSGALIVSSYLGKFITQPESVASTKIKTD